MKRKKENTERKGESMKYDPDDKTQFCKVGYYSDENKGVHGYEGPGWYFPWDHGLRGPRDTKEIAEEDCREFKRKLGEVNAIYEMRAQLMKGIIPKPKYDSTADTLKHIRTVGSYLIECIEDIHDRIVKHDETKLEDPEKKIFDEFTPKLRDTTYGSEEYKKYLEQMGVGLAHHYKHNAHHPEHHEHGIKDMTLIDLVEMLADWKAATLRHADGDLARSIEQNQERFGYSDELKQILVNTAESMGWI